MASWPPGRLTPLELERGGHVTVLDGQLPTGATLVVLFDAPAFFDRPSVYGPAYGSEHAAEGEFPDNAERFAFLCDAAHALVKQRAERAPFDVVHLHDWSTAALALSLAEAAPKVPSVLTIHDGARRGIVPAAEFERLGQGVPDPTRRREGSGVSLLACGARAADAVTSVSTTVATDIVDPARVGALARVLAGREGAGDGDPERPRLCRVQPRDRRGVEVALRRRRSVQQGQLEDGAPAVAAARARYGTRPSWSWPSSAAGEDGAAILLERAAEAILKNDVSMSRRRSRRGAASSELEALRSELGDRLAVEHSRDEALVRRACAAADIVLLAVAAMKRPRRSPDALSATARLPIARAARGTRRRHRRRRTRRSKPERASSSTRRRRLRSSAPSRAALAAYGSARWPVLRRRVMRQDLAWDRPARRYAQVYRQAVAGLRGEGRLSRLEDRSGGASTRSRLTASHLTRSAHRANTVA